MSRRGWILFIALSVIWGLPYLFIKIADSGVAVPVLVLARVAIGTAVLLPVAIRRRQLGAVWGVWPWAMTFAFVEIIIPWFALSQAERTLSSSLSGLLVASVPVIVVILSLLTRTGDRVSAVRWIGLLVGLAGVAMLAGPNVFGAGAGRGTAVGVGEVLFVALCYATGPLIANRRLASVPPLAMTAACLGLATVVSAPVAAANWPARVPPARVLLALAVLGLVCTAVAFLIFFRLIAEVGPARASVITYLNPAVAVTLGVLVLHERVTALMLGAFATVLFGSVLATRPAARPARDLVGSTAVPTEAGLMAGSGDDIGDMEART